MKSNLSKKDNILKPEKQEASHKIKMPIDINTAYSMSKHEILNFINKNKIITIQIPLFSINSTNSYIDIICDYIEASYVAETVSNHSKRKDIQINFDLFHYPVVHLSLKPTNANKFAEALLDLSKGFSGEDDESRLDFVSNLDQYESEIDNKIFIYPELIDDYYANLINGAYYELAHESYEGNLNDEPEKIESAYFDKIYTKFPERKYGYWKSAYSKNINQDFFCSTEGWIIPNSSDFTTIVKKYSHIDKLEFTKANFFIIGNISYLMSNGNIIHFPFDSFLRAKLCSSVISKSEYSSYNSKDIWMNRFLTFNRLISNFDSSKENYRGYPEDRAEEIISQNNKDNDILLPPPVVSFYLNEYDELLIIKDSNFSYLFFELDKLKYKELISLENRLSELFYTTSEIAGIHTKIDCHWERLNDEKFEELCYDIIYHNPKFDNTTIRKMGKSRSRDGGRDIVVYTQSRPGYQKEKYIFQCKYLCSGSSLTARKVTDISDTIDQYNAEGYGIMTSVVIDATLYDKLDAIAVKKKIRVEQYSVYELERILARHPILKKRHFDD
ncbi:MAG: hypothetical protein JXN64_10220 [Spirochaetes bacterium]|nr:hypothetical protein [Spirochaetota bacterium]